jgi:hypothetical protein
MDHLEVTFHSDYLKYSNSMIKTTYSIRITCFLGFVHELMKGQRGTYHTGPERESYSQSPDPSESFQYSTQGALAAWCNVVHLHHGGLLAFNNLLNQTIKKICKN